jgi:hypothetical protein
MDALVMRLQFAQLVRTTFALAMMFALLRAPRDASAETPVAAPCYAAPQPCGKRLGDQFWVMSTRHLGCLPTTVVPPTYRVQYFAQHAWHRSNVESFLSRDKSALPTVIFIHGNRYNSSDAINSGWKVYYALTRRLPTDQPIRFVVWSWPSDQQRGQLRDVRSKMARTTVEGYYLSRMLTRIEPEVPTGIVGYSYGSRVALGAVHLAGGGQLAGRVVPNLDRDEAPAYRLALLAAGVEDNGLMPGARFEMAMSRTDHLLSLYNPADPALKRFRLVNKWERPTAMGYSGIAGKPYLGDAAARITECNVSGIVGRTHDDDTYWQSEQVMCQVRQVVLGRNYVEKLPELAGK